MTLSDSERLFWLTVAPWMIAFDLIVVGLCILSTAIG